MRRVLPILLTFCAAGLHADVTVRYKTEMKGSLQGLMQQSGALSSVVPTDSELRIKGTRSYTSYGSAAAIGDSSTKAMILLDRDGKKFAPTVADEYYRAIKAAMPSVPPAVAEMMAAFKVKAESRMTGRSETIHGIEAEEREVVLSLENPSMPNMMGGPMLRVVMRIWTSKATETARVPAVRELVAFNESSLSALNTNGSIQQMLEMIPGLGQSLGTAMQDLTHVATLRLHVDLFMPALAGIIQKMPAGSSPFGNIDPQGPLMQVDQEMADLSTAPIPDSQFQVPPQYQQESMNEFMKTYLTHLLPAGN